MIMLVVRILDKKDEYKEKLKELMERKEIIETQIRWVAWNYKYPGIPFDKDKSFPYKKIIREEFNIVI